MPAKAKRYPKLTAPIEEGETAVISQYAALFFYMRERRQHLIFGRKMRLWFGADINHDD